MSSHSIGSKESELELPLFDVRRIKAATDDFSVDKILGVGGFGPVYKVTFSITGNLIMNLIIVYRMLFRRTVF